MTMQTRWSLPLALAAGAVVGAGLALLSRGKRRRLAGAQHKEHLQAWEGEGGSLQAPAPAAPIESEQATPTGSYAP